MFEKLDPKETDWQKVIIFVEDDETMHRFYEKEFNTKFNNKIKLVYYFKIINIIRIVFKISYLTTNLIN